MTQRIYLTIGASFILFASVLAFAWTVPTPAGVGGAISAIQAVYADEGGGGEGEGDCGGCGEGGEYGGGEYGGGEYGGGEYGGGEYGAGEYGAGEYGAGEYGEGYECCESEPEYECCEPEPEYECECETEGGQVEIPPPPPPQQPKKPFCKIKAYPDHIIIFEDPTLTWTSSNATHAVLNQGIGAVPVNGSYNVFPEVTTTYTLTVYGPGGSATCSTTITVTVIPAEEEPSCDIWADAYWVQYNGMTTIRWSSENADSASINNGIGSVSVNGSRYVSGLTSDRTYTLTVWGEGGSATCSVTIEVGDAPDLEPWCEIWASPSHVTRGNGTTLSWNSANAEGASINQGIGSVAVDGSRWVSNLQSTRTYTLTVWNDAGSYTCNTTVTVEDEEEEEDEPSCSIWANPSHVNEGSGTTLTWNSDNATSASISQGIGSVAVDGSRWVSNIWNTRTYTLTVWGSGGSATCSTTVTVDHDDDEEDPPSCSIWADPSHVTYNGQTTLHWSIDGDATSASINQGVGSVSTDDGSRTVYNITSNRTYTMNVWGPDGSSQCQTTVTTSYVPQYDRPSCSIYNSGSGYAGGGTTLTWNSQNATSAHLSNHGSVSTNGSLMVYPDGTKTYTLTVYGYDGRSATCETIVYGDHDDDDEDPSCWISLTPQNYQWYNYNYWQNRNATLTWGSDNAYSATISPNIGSVSTSGSRTVNTDGYQQYTMTVYGKYGKTDTCRTSYNPPHVPPYTPPSSNLYCTITVSQNNVQYGSNVHLNWTSYGAHSAWLSDGLGTVSTSGSLSIRPDYNRSYTLTVKDYNGHTNTCQVYVTVNGGHNYPFIALTQIPYTGFGDPMSSAFYWLAVMGAAAAGAYALMRYKGREMLAFSGLGNWTSNAVTSDEEDDGDLEPIVMSEARA